MNELMYNYFF